jgi:hypothetical protein
MVKDASGHPGVDIRGHDGGCGKKSPEPKGVEFATCRTSIALLVLGYHFVFLLLLLASFFFFFRFNPPGLAMFGAKGAKEVAGVICRGTHLRSCNKEKWERSNMRRPPTHTKCTPFFLEREIPKH